MGKLELLLLLLLLVSLFALKLDYRSRRAKRYLPANGFRGVWSNYSDSVWNYFRAKSAIRDACFSFSGSLFTFSLLGQWVVLAKEKDHVRELCNAPEDVLSMEAAAEELLQLRHTVGPLFSNELYHIPVIRTKLNLNLEEIFPPLVDEIHAAFSDIINTQIGKADWASIKVLPTFSRIICRATNRILVGSHLCRNEEYCKLASGFTNDVLSIGPVLKFLVPNFFRPQLKVFPPPSVRYLSNKEVQNDMLSWLMEASPLNEEYSTESLSMRMLNVNFVALHTTTKTFTHAIYCLASQPQYISILRAEVEQQLDSGDTTTWTREALGRCVRLDSFLKETLRLHGLGAIWMPRLAVSDFSFSDGTHIPPGYFVATAATAVHENDALYENARDFNGLRFSSMRKGTFGRPETEKDWQYKMTSNSESYLAFGGGRHLCILSPGRFFASMEMKCLMAYLVLHYDLKTLKDGVRPPDEWFGPTSNPARNARVLFHRR
ncbi:cytochrome P450 [Lentinula aff. lateritia]|uniref:Cytochrome P450 n=1 Tax=Lentinula aff. lateritia TaxID=2804960 RepID=A0ACC1TST3_9AGAR|nr:cytochrome P450 [Lentinula aff. lateritia]